MLFESSQAASTAMERLATGSKINSVQDDVAGSAIADRMTSQVRGLNMAVKNVNDAMAMLSVADNAAGDITDMLQRMRELAIQAASDTNSAADRQYLQDEVSALIQEIDTLTKQVKYNGRTLLNGSFDNTSAQIGIRQGESITLKINDMGISALGLGRYTNPGISEPVSIHASDANLVTNEEAFGIKGPSVGVSPDGKSSIASMLIYGYRPNVFNYDLQGYVTASFDGESPVQRAGVTIDGNWFLVGNSATPSASYSLDISDGGAYVVLGNHGTNYNQHVNVYRYNETSLSYEQFGDTIRAPFEKWEYGGIPATSNSRSGGQTFGYDVSLSSDGHVLAVGNPTYSGTHHSASGRVDLYDWNGARWHLRTSIINGTDKPTSETQYTSSQLSTFHFGATVNLAGDASVIEVGEANNAYNEPYNLANTYFHLESDEARYYGPIDILNNPSKAFEALDAAIEKVTEQRAEYGAMQNRLLYTVSNLMNISEQTTAARSRIEDVDFATESAALAKAQVLQQSGAAMLAQANARPQLVLQLVK